MKIGEVWELKNEYTHGVDNKSNFRRVHIIADWDID